MRVRIAVCDPLPAFRLGIQAILRDAGYEAEAPEDLLSWVSDDQQRLVWLTVQTANDWAMLEKVRREHADTIVVAMLDNLEVGTYVRALLAGAASAVPRDASLRSMREAAAAALSGNAVVPFDVLRALSTMPCLPQEPDAPSDVEREWLQQLAHGTKVNQLAKQAGYSERMMFRLLSDLYAKIGTTNRIDALMRAKEVGWIL